MAEFKVGDRVRCVVDDEYDSVEVKTGDEVIVSDAAPWDFPPGTFGAFVGEKRFIGFNRRFTLVVEKPAEPAVRQADMVYQPPHYARFVIEPITFINANGLPYNIGNVIKYACRYDAKNGVEDLEKAKRYLEIHIETLKRLARVKAGEEAKEVWKVAL